MNSVTRDQWIKALESGRYKKGTGALRKRYDNKNHYCCLGVICNLASPSWGENGNGAIPSVHLRFGDDENGYMNTTVINYSIQSELAEVNDSSDTFDEVVEVIKKYWPENTVIIDPARFE